MNAKQLGLLIVFTSALYLSLANGWIVNSYADRFLQLKSIVRAKARFMSLKSVNKEFRGESFRCMANGSRGKVLCAIRKPRVPINWCIRLESRLSCMTSSTSPSPSAAAGGFPSTPSLPMLRLRTCFRHSSQTQVSKCACWCRHELRKIL